jgi:beta-lactamase regulating signal transducer with metallopeptidase domain
MIVPAVGHPLLHSLVIALLALGVVLVWTGRWGVRVRQAVPVVAFVLLLGVSAGLPGLLPRWEISAPGAVASWSAAMESRAAPWLAWIFVTGAVLQFARIGATSVAVRRIVRGARPATGRAWKTLLVECRRALGLRGPVRILFAGPDFIPSATGLIRRTVLLPDEALHWTHEQRRLVLLHELGHFRRGDLWTQMLGEIACALHWFNPFAWMLHRRLALEREFACDALVVSRGASPADYATLLWKMGVASRGPRLAAAAFLSMAAPGRGKLEQRVRRILAPVRETALWLRVADSVFCGLAALLLVACVSLKPVVVRSFLGISPWTVQEIEARLAAAPFPGGK